MKKNALNIGSVVSAWRMVVVLSAALLLVGCSTPSYVVLLPNPDGTVGKVMLQGAAGGQMVNQAQYGALLDGSKAPTPVSNETLERDFGDAMRARPPLPEIFTLYFQSQGTDLAPQSHALLPYVIERVGLRKSVDLSVVGHADAMGSDSVNEALALRRAHAVARKLYDMGLKNVPMVIESYGKRMPRVPTPDGASEPLNRRVEITVR